MADEWEQMCGGSWEDEHAAKEADRVLIARCENVMEPDGQECAGRLRYRWGQTEAACDTCGGRCGIAVAAWLEVQPNAEVEARVQAAGNQLAREQLEAAAREDSIGTHRLSPVEVLTLRVVKVEDLLARIAALTPTERTSP